MHKIKSIRVSFSKGRTKIDFDFIYDEVKKDYGKMEVLPHGRPLS